MKNIAIIDDEPSIRLVLRGFLEEAGFNVVAEAGDGVDALRICESVEPDLILMDVQMEKMSGIEATREISAKCPTPVILLTACDDKETIERAVEAGVMAYLVKPIKEEDLLPAISVAASRFGEYKLLRDEVKDLKDSIKIRKLVERAKGLLMDREGLSEDEAFNRIRRVSMDKRISMGEVAEVLIVSLES